MSARYKEICKIFSPLVIQEKKFNDRIEYWSDLRYLTSDWLCFKCKKWINFDLISFSKEDGTLSARDGKAICQSCLDGFKIPKEKSLKENKKKISKKIKSK